MTTASAAVLDFYDDTKHEHMSKVAMPAEMRGVHLSMLTPEQHSTLPDSDFGLILLTKRASVLRKFPVNDPGNAWLSAQYFGQACEKLAFPARFVAAKFIKSACDAYGVPSSRPVEAYAARTDDEVSTNVFVEGSEKGWMLRKLAQRELIEKTADVGSINAMAEMPNKHFALVVQTGDGAVIRKYAMPDSDHVKKAASYFDKYAMDLQPEYRHRFAVSVLNRADELGVDVSGHDGISKWASTTWNQHVGAHLEQRKSLLPRNPSARDVLNKLAASMAETTPADMAEALQVFDRATGLTRYYDKGLTDPYSSTMGKVADGWSEEVDGETVTAADLQKACDSGKLVGYFGQAFCDQFKKNPTEIYESLPDPEKQVIKQVASGEA
jgi:hypothetical protein